MRNRRTTGRRSMGGIPRLLCLGLLLPMSCGRLGAHSDDSVETDRREAPFRSSGLGHDHNDITEQGLPMLPSSLGDTLGDANEAMDCWTCDKRLTDEYHMDNCQFVGSFDKLRHHYELVLAALDPAAFDREASVEYFGRILHAAQDFVSHSNWLEQGETGVLHGGGLLPPAAPPGSLIGNLVVVQKGMPSHWVLSRGASGAEARRVMVDDGASVRRGLITGTYEDNFGDPSCPAAASIPHGSGLVQCSAASALTGCVHLYLAKDDPDSFMHKEAVALAKRQTTEELCRLDRMVSLRYGVEGSTKFRSQWQVNLPKLEAACPQNAGLVAAVITATL